MSDVMVIVTTYGLARRDIAELSAISWGLIVADEPRPAPTGLEQQATADHYGSLLVQLGYSVTAMDPSAAMLANFVCHVRELDITTTTDVIDDYLGPPILLVCCMGDRLTHLDNRNRVEATLTWIHQAMLDLADRSGCSAAVHARSNMMLGRVKVRVDVLLVHSGTG